MPVPSLLAVDWTPVIVAALTLAGVIITVASQVFFFLYIRPTSGGRLGSMMERTHANSAASLAAVTGLEEDTNGKTTHPPTFTRRDGHE